MFKKVKNFIKSGSAKVMNRDLFIPTEEVCTKFNSILAVMPYSRNLKQQMLDGRMYERLNDKRLYLS